MSIFLSNVKSAIYILSMCLILVSKRLMFLNALAFVTITIYADVLYVESNFVYAPVMPLIHLAVFNGISMIIVLILYKHLIQSKNSSNNS